MSDELPTATPPAAVVAASPTVEVTPTPTTPAIAQPPIKNLILDAAPLLTLTPLRGMASKYIIAPQVLAEIRDKRAREHFDRLSLLEGVEVQIRDVDAVSLAKVTAFAKQTGDYAVLSHTDLCVLALTYAVEVEENGHWRVREELGKPPAGRPPVAGSTPAPAAPAALPETPSSQPTTTAPPLPPATTDAPLPTTSQPPSTSPKNAPPTLPSTSTWGKKAPTTPYLATPAPSNNITVVAPPPPAASSSSSKPEDAPSAVEEQEIIYHDDDEPSQEPSSEAGPSTSSSSANPVDDASSSLAALGLNNDEDPFSEDDEDAGEWITSTNISTHKARDLGLSLPETAENSKTKSKKNKKSKPRAILKSACMTSDFAVQNVLLQMGLNLVGGEGRRIRSVRSWVLRCHACFKLCKDPTKKFCPSCGGPTLLRTSITTVAPSANTNPNSTSTTPAAPTTIVHLKKNFQYHLRGTQYSIPAPKPGSSKSQSSGGSGLVLREDQAEWQRGVRMEEGRRVKAEKKLQRGLEEGRGAGTWRDADWMPEMYAVGAAGKGRAGVTGRDGGWLPDVGHGRRNPNAVKRGGKRK